MAYTRTAAIRSLLRDADPVTTARLQEDLREDGELLRAVWLDALAHQDACPLVAELLLEAERGSILQRYAEAENLEDGMYVLAEVHQPGVDHRARCLPLLQDLEAQLPPGGEASELARALGQLGFAGDQHNYHAPENSFLPCVLQRKRGLPITLTALWLLLCHRRGLEAQAIALPGHVLGRANGVLFDLFQGGKAVTVSALVREQGSVQREQLQALLEPASERTLLQRMARNLISTYHLQRDETRMHLVRQMSQRAMTLSSV